MKKSSFSGVFFLFAILSLIIYPFTNDGFLLVGILLCLGFYNLIAAVEENNNK